MTGARQPGAGVRDRLEQGARARDAAARRRRDRRPRRRRRSTPPASTSRRAPRWSTRRRSARSTCRRWRRRRRRPVAASPAYPVPRYPLTAPKIALYTGGTTDADQPGLPRRRQRPLHVARPTARWCSRWRRQLNVPVSRLVPLTSTELAAGDLVSQGFTAIVNPGSTIAAGAGATALQTLRQRRRQLRRLQQRRCDQRAQRGPHDAEHVGDRTCAPFNAHCPDNNDPAAAGSLTTPGTAFNASSTSTNPLAWGFDEGGYIYRDVERQLRVRRRRRWGRRPPRSPTRPLVRRSATSATRRWPARCPGRPYAVDQAVRRRARHDDRLQRVLPRLDRGRAAARDERRAVPDERPGRAADEGAARAPPGAQPPGDRVARPADRRDGRGPRVAGERAADRRPAGEAAAGAAGHATHAAAGG